jgi:outer membrane immunogenic protein
MKLRIVGFAVAATVVGLNSAQAQTPTVDIPASAYGPVWTGFYTGVAVGLEAMVDQVNTSIAGASLNVNGLGGQGALGAIYGGVDYQFMPQALVGAMVELSYGGPQATASAVVPGAAATASTQADLGWSALVRAGVLPSPSTLLYAIGGYSGLNLHTTATAAGGGGYASYSRTDTFNGWTIGTGIETLLPHGWSAKLEYRYSQYEQKTLPGTTLAFSPSIHSARIGLTYRFGAPGEARSEAAAASTERKVNWTGVYLGGGAGAGVVTNHLNASFGGASAGVDSGGQGLLGSVFAGADYQFADQALVGVMGDLTWSGLSTTATTAVGGALATVTSKENMAWSLLARLGFLPTPSTLIYAAGGYTGATFNTTASAVAGGTSAVLSQDNSLSGWTVGPGVEMRISDGWSTRIEYRYTQFAQGSTNGVSYQPSTQTVRAGLSYKFDLGQ